MRQWHTIITISRLTIGITCVVPIIVTCHDSIVIAMFCCPIQSTGQYVFRLRVHRKLCKNRKLVLQKNPPCTSLGPFLTRRVATPNASRQHPDWFRRFTMHGPLFVCLLLFFSFFYRASLFRMREYQRMRQDSRTVQIGSRQI
jgi:hypothetical protein